jgi:PII-like signaling protein
MEDEVYRMEQSYRFIEHIETKISEIEKDKEKKVYLIRILEQIDEETIEQGNIPIRLEGFYTKNLKTEDIISIRTMLNKLYNDLELKMTYEELLDIHENGKDDITKINRYTGIKLRLKKNRFNDSVIRENRDFVQLEEMLSEIIRNMARFNYDQNILLVKEIRTLNNSLPKIQKYIDRNEKINEIKDQEENLKNKFIEGIEKRSKR